MKLAQSVYLFFNQSQANKLSCTRCHKDLSYNPDKVPPLVFTNHTRPYCITCVYRLNMGGRIGIVTNKLATENRGH